jgi:hypothetical protein
MTSGLAFLIAATPIGLCAVIIIGALAMGWRPSWPTWPDL